GAELFDRYDRKSGADGTRGRVVLFDRGGCVWGSPDLAAMAGRGARGAVSGGEPAGVGLRDTGGSDAGAAGHGGVADFIVGDPQGAGRWQAAGGGAQTGTRLYSEAQSVRY